MTLADGFAVGMVFLNQDAVLAATARAHTGEELARKAWRSLVGGWCLSILPPVARSL